MSRIAILTEDLAKLKDQGIIVEYVHMQPKWLITFKTGPDQFFTNKEASAFVLGATTWQTNRLYCGWALS